MKRGWKVILIIVLAAVLLGAVCVAVGLVTGADSNRILGVLDEHYNFTAYLTAYRQYAGDVADALLEAWQTPAA